MNKFASDPVLGAAVVMVSDGSVSLGSTRCCRGGGGSVDFPFVLWFHRRGDDSSDFAMEPRSRARSWCPDGRRSRRQNRWALELVWICTGSAGVGWRFWFSSSTASTGGARASSRCWFRGLAPADEPQRRRFVFDEPLLRSIKLQCSEGAAPGVVSWCAVFLFSGCCSGGVGGGKSAAVGCTEDLRDQSVIFLFFGVLCVVVWNQLGFQNHLLYTYVSCTTTFSE